MVIELIHLHYLSNLYLNPNNHPSFPFPFLISLTILHILHMVIPFLYRFKLRIEDLEYNRFINIQCYLDNQNRFSNNFLMPFENVPFFYNNWQPSISISHLLSKLVLLSQNISLLSHTSPT